MARFRVAAARAARRWASGGATPSRRDQERRQHGHRHDQKPHPTDTCHHKQQYCPADRQVG